MFSIGSLTITIVIKNLFTLCSPSPFLRLHFTAYNHIQVLLNQFRIRILFYNQELSFEISDQLCNEKRSLYQQMDPDLEL